MEIVEIVSVMVKKIENNTLNAGKNPCITQKNNHNSI